MSIIWCGGEDIDFPNGGGITSNTSRQRPAYARVGIISTSSSRSNAFQAGAITSGWLHFYCSWIVNSSNRTLAGLVESVSGKGIFARISSTTAKFSIALFDGAYTDLATETGASFTSEGSVDLQITNFGIGSNIKLFFNGNLIIDWTGDSSISGVSGLDAVCIVGVSVTGYYLSELIVADEDTRLMSLKTLAPNASGDASAWTNGYTSIDETTNSDSDTVYSETADQEFQCNLTGMPAGDFICKGVKVCSRLTDGVGGMDVQTGIRTNSTTVLGSAVGVDAVWGSFETLYQNNPVTSNRFTPAEIEALQLAFKSVVV